MIAVLAATTLLSIGSPQILVFSKTAGYRHDSILDGKKCLMGIANKNRWNVTFSEDSQWFTQKRLNGFSCVVFLSTTGDILNDEQQAALQNFVETGGGFVGIHAAADTEYGWPWYETLAGAWFKSHPRIQKAKVVIEDAKHPTTQGLPKEWMRTDEWYCYRTSPRGKVHVLASLDESTYEGATMKGDHPIMWCNPVKKGRSWYTGGGHTAEAFVEALFVDHLTLGIKWAGRL